MKGITWSELTKGAITVSADPRPEPPAGSVTYRCGASIFIHKTEWRTACLNRKEPGCNCACNQQQQEGREAA